MSKMSKFFLKQLFEEPEPSGAGEPEKGKGTENKAGAGEEKKDGTEKKYSDEELDAIINKKFAKWKADEQKKIDEAAKLAKMTAQEKAEHERDELQKELDALKREKALSDMGKTARQILSENDIALSDSLVEMLITEDAEQTKENLAKFTEAFKAAVQAELKKQLSGKTPKAGGEKTGITKEEILKIKDPVKRRQAIAENLELFNKRK